MHVVLDAKRPKLLSWGSIMMMMMIIIIIISIFARRPVVLEPLAAETAATAEEPRRFEE